MDTVSRATGVPLQDGVEGLTVQPPPPPGGSHDLDRAERPIAEGQGLRRRVGRPRRPRRRLPPRDRKSTRLNSSHRCISYAVFCLKKKTIGLINLRSSAHYLPSAPKSAPV